MRPRALAIVFAVLLLGWPASPRPAGAASPASGTISDSAQQIAWTGSSTLSDPTFAFNPATCQSKQVCDLFTLTINVSDTYRADNPTFGVSIRIEWNTGANDYDLYVMKDGAIVAQSPQFFRHQFFTSAEDVQLFRPANGAYQVFVQSFGTVPTTPYNGQAMLLAGIVPRLRTAVYQKDPDGKFGAQVFLFTSDLRLIGARQGLDGQNIEPEIAINNFGTIYVAAIQAVPGGTDFWRSRDGGDSFQYLGQPDGVQDPTINSQREASVALGGGDTDVTFGAPAVLLELPGGGKVDTTGRVYVTSLWVGNSTQSISVDEGDNFLVSQQTIPVIDRQWIAGAGTSRLYFTSKQLGGVVAFSSRSLYALQSDDGGLTFPRGGFIAPLLTTPGSGRQGHIIANPAPGADPPNVALYNAFADLSPGNGDLYLARCFAPCNLPVFNAAGVIDPTQRVFMVRRIFRGHGFTVDNVFPIVAVDRGGGIHVAFSDKSWIYLTSSPDGGQTWKDPVRVQDGPDTRTAILPWVIAGDSGRVGVMWYGSAMSGDPDFSTAAWKLFYAFTANAFADTPTFTQVVASGRNDAAATELERSGVVHVGVLCTRGSGCASGTRRIAEYSSMAGDLQGFTNLVIAGTVNTPNGFARVNFTKQVAGPNLFLQPIVTGGGSIGSDVAQRNFGFNVHGDLPAGPYAGSLTFLDKAADLLFKASTITTVTVEGNKVTFSGSGTLQRGTTVGPATFTAVAVDNGEPGAGNDTFAITLSTGYSASGVLRGGNIQRH